MTLAWDIMVRMHRGEVAPAEAFRLQAAAEGAPPARPGLRVPCVVGPSLARSGGFRAMAAWLAQCGVTLDVSTDFHRYADRWRRARNWATWGVKWDSPTYRRGRKRVLFIENGLLSQSSGFYVDDAGYFADSSIVTDRDPPTHAEVAAMQAHCQRLSGRPWWSGGDPAGPVLIALQDNRDGAVRARQYPLRDGNPNAATLLYAAAALPRGAPVVVRRHPNDTTTPPALPDGWRFDDVQDKWASIARCRAMVTATSTLATEALALGLPVAALGRSCWVGSGAVLDCSTDPARAAQLLNWHPDEWDAIRYLVSVLRHQVGYSDTADRIATLPPLRRWVRAVTAREAPGLDVAAAASWLDRHGTEAHRAVVARWRACRTCARGRLARQLLDLATAAGYRSQFA